ncbi:glycosyltransferase [Curtobacterium sp. Leaf261]|uniref:glycosyltransferase n=1 Tax=Curtobacterium sp. Leaf261 TaxID=1736311 RepID=UPI0006FF4FBF|nr:glycosyltransferase [Curtobacterium sp. Leaf261]KQO62164.1 glycosyl transferase [Curtobacterium sp. Leaf261]
MTVTTPGTVSVVIINYRGTDDTLECVARLNEVDWPTKQLEIVVVENGSGDDSESRLRAAIGDQENVKLVVSTENLGFTGGSNLGANEASGEFVAFLNNDAKPDRNWIRAGLTGFAESPRVAAVASKVLDWDGKAIDFVESGLSWFGMGYKAHVTEIDDGTHDEEKDLLFGTGSALFVRRSVFLEVGGFDEGLFMFYDDVDLGWRLNLLGYRVRYVPTSVVFHKHHGSMKSFGEYREMYLLERNALHLLYKNLSDDSLGTYLPAALALLARRAVAKSGLDSTAFDIRKFVGAEDEFDSTTPVAKDTVAGLFALDQFVADLPRLQEERRRIQSARVRTDTEIFPLFGNAFHPLFEDPYYLEGFEGISNAFQVEQPMERKRVLVITGDALGEKMAGPGMRAWKIAEALSANNDVRLLTWNVANRKSDKFLVERVPLQHERHMKSHEEWADVIFFQGYALHHFQTLQRSNKIMVVDLYDPMHLEQLEQARDNGDSGWKAQVEATTGVVNAQLERGDFFLCASERQRLFWLGQLAALGRVNPANYLADENLGKLIAIAPFGMDSTPPQHTRKAIRGVVPGIGEDDKVIIWGGGIYNWFDTPTLVRAVAQVAERHDDVKLFFLGVAHPNPDVPEMAIVAKTRELSAQLGLTGKHVFFNEQWVALDDRQNYLTEANVGVSTHFAHIETTFSFRTRILDYMWANLPIVTTGGDSFGDLVAAEGMGVAVQERDVDALAAALESMLYDDEAAGRARRAVQRVREEFTWERALAPLVEFCKDPYPAADRADDAALPAGASAGAVRERIAMSPVRQRELRFHQIANSRHGIRRDVLLARHYLQDVGVSGLRDKVQNRVRTMRESKNGR